MKTHLLSVLFVLVSLSLLGQNKSFISGKVTDSVGAPLPFASIRIKEAGIGTVADEYGNFYLKTGTGDFTVIAQLLGYDELQVSVSLKNGGSLLLPLKLNRQEKVLKDVVVSAFQVKGTTVTRAGTKIQDIPQAITVVGQRLKNEQAAFDLTTITRNISGLNFTGSYGGAGSSQFFNARGFDLNDSQNYRLNGMTIWNMGSNYWDNIEQVEFIKGPGSILFGDMAPGGVLNFVTKKPLSEFMLQAELKTGSWGLFRPSLDVSGPFNKERTLRYRLISSYEGSDSFRDKVSYDKQFIAPSLAWDISPKLSLLVETVFKKSRATDDAGLVSPDGTIRGLDDLDPSLYLGEPGRDYLYDDQNSYATLSYQLNNTWRLKAVGFYANTHRRPFGMWFDQPDENGDFARREYGYHEKAETTSASIDLQGTFYTGAFKHRVLLGSEFQVSRHRYTNGGTLSLYDTNNINNPVYGRTPDVEPLSSPYSPFVSTVKRSGIFIQDQLSLYKERIQLQLGLRAGMTRQGNDYYEDLLPGTEYEGYFDNIISKNVLTPRVGILYKPVQSHSFYLSWSKGYEINSPDIFARNFQDFATPPATISSQLEAGAKSDLFNRNLFLTFSIFDLHKRNPYGYVYLDRENPNYDEYDVYYDGHHRSRGIELEIDGKVLEVLSLTGGVAYTKTKVVEDPGYPSGNLLPNAPAFTGNFWINYKPLKKLQGLSLGSGIFYKGSFFSGISNDPDLKIPASYTLDIAAGYRYRKIAAQLNVRNLTNQISYLNPWQFNLFDVQPLRQAVVSLSYSIN